MRKLAAIATLLSVAIGVASNDAVETFASLIAKSNIFAQLTPFPTKHNRIKAIANSDLNLQLAIAQHANTARPIMDVRVLQLLEDFLFFKQQHGSLSEKQLYKNMDVAALVDRLLQQRPLMFMTAGDQYLLRNGQVGQGGFEAIGTAQEKNFLVQDYLSYDEMQLAALIGVSTPTFFINNGARDNRGIPALPDTYQQQGVYTGLVGARFEKPGLMEWSHMIITPQQNTRANGYGLQPSELQSPTLLTLWSKFYQTKFPTFAEAQADVSGRYVRLAEDQYLHVEVYKKRLKTVIRPFLIDANQRAAAQNQSAYCHVVGLGLGVWQLAPIQAKLMLDVYYELIQECDLKSIADINFSWFPPAYQQCGTTGHLQSVKANGNHIKIHFSQRNPADKLVGLDANKLLVAMYAWDSNAYPGNEYWAGKLTASGDPAAACCSTIAELQNPLINRNISAAKLLVV